MAGSRKTTVIVNPNAGTGAAARRWLEIGGVAARLLGPHRIRLTGGAGEAVRFAHEALMDGVERVVCVGGDGTLNEVVNGLFLDGAERAKGILVGYIPCGTGCDFARTLSIPANPRRALEAAARDNRRHVDVGLMAFRGNNGDTVHRFFHNVASFGLGGEVDERVNRGSKAMGGFLSFIAATLVSILFFRKKRIRIRIDGGPVLETLAWNVAVANGQFHGGGMWVAPNALPDDGLFHVTVIGDFALGEVLVHLPKLYKGTHLHLPKIRSLTGRRVEAWSSQRVLVDVDGEQPGRLPACLDILPNALSLAVDPHSPDLRPSKSVG